MTITIKTAEEIDKMRVAGKLAAEVLEMIAPYVVAGISTEELDQICHDYIVDVQQAIPAPLNYRGFPKSICTSINQQICHGIPSEKKTKERRHRKYRYYGDKGWLSRRHQQNVLYR